MYVNNIHDRRGDIFEECVSKIEKHLRAEPYDIIVHVQNRLPMEYSSHRNLTSKFSQAYIDNSIDFLLNDVYIDETPNVIPVEGALDEMMLQIIQGIARCE